MLFKYLLHAALKHKAWVPDVTEIQCSIIYFFTCMCCYFIKCKNTTRPCSQLPSPFVGTSGKNPPQLVVICVS